MTETTRLDSSSDLYLKNALRHLEQAKAELAGGIEVQEDEDILQALESANLALGSVSSGLAGALDMMHKRGMIVDTGTADSESAATDTN